MQPGRLQTHPEGGRFREVFRSPSEVSAATRGSRTAATHIYFELRAGERSLFHRVQSDEVWNLYEGEGVRLFQWHEEQGTLETIELRRDTRSYCHVVSANVWQAAEPIGSQVLVGCTVAPGFEFSDFEILSTNNQRGKNLLDAHPSLRSFLEVPTKE